MDGIDLMATALQAARTRLDASAANLANVASDGFARHVARVSLSSRGLVAGERSDTTPGALHRTGRSLDLAVAGRGGFFVRDTAGRDVLVRSASFARDDAGRFVDASGRVLLGEHGAIVADASATLDARGRVVDGGVPVAGVRTLPGTALRGGFREVPNVDAVREMVEMLGAERSFETAQKTLVALDETRAKSVDDVARVKA